MSKFKVVSALKTVNYVHYSWNIYDDSWMAYMVDCIVYPDGPGRVAPRVLLLRLQGKQVCAPA